MVVLEVICRRVDPRDPSALITTQLLYGMGRRVLLPCWLACHQGHITPRHWIMRLPKPPRWCQQERAVHPISVCDCRRTYLDTDPDVQKSSQPLSPTTCHEAQVYQTSSPGFPTDTHDPTRRAIRYAAELGFRTADTTGRSPFDLRDHVSISRPSILLCHQGQEQARSRTNDHLMRLSAPRSSCDGR